RTKEQASGAGLDGPAALPADCRRPSRNMSDVQGVPASLPNGQADCLGAARGSFREWAGRMIRKSLVVLDQVESTERPLVGKLGKLPRRGTHGFQHSAEQRAVGNFQTCPQAGTAEPWPGPGLEECVGQLHPCDANSCF